MIILVSVIDTQVGFIEKQFWKDRGSSCDVEDSRERADRSETPAKLREDRHPNERLERLLQQHERRERLDRIERVGRHGHQGSRKRR